MRVSQSTRVLCNSSKDSRVSLGLFYILKSCVVSLGEPPVHLSQPVPLRHPVPLRPPVPLRTNSAPTSFSAPTSVLQPVSVPSDFSAPSGFSAPSDFSAPSGFSAPSDFSASPGFSAPSVISQISQRVRNEKCSLFIFNLSIFSYVFPFYIINACFHGTMLGVIAMHILVVICCALLGVVVGAILGVVLVISFCVLIIKNAIIHKKLRKDEKVENANRHSTQFSLCCWNSLRTVHNNTRPPQRPPPLRTLPKAPLGDSDNPLDPLGPPPPDPCKLRRKLPPNRDVTTCVKTA
jgi:hypothetical protein